jgi:hypothetical protein
MFTKSNLAFSSRNLKNIWVLGRARFGLHLWFARMSLFWHWIATRNFKKWIATRNVRVNYKVAWVIKIVNWINFLETIAFLRENQVRSDIDIKRIEICFVWRFSKFMYVRFFGKGKVGSLQRGFVGQPLVQHPLN